MRKLIALHLCLAGLVGACSTNHPPEYFAPPPMKTLAAPPSDKAIVYLMRTPHDRAKLTVNIDGKSVAMPPDTYVAVAVTPGTHTVTTREQSGGVGAPDIAVSATSGQHSFYYVSSHNGMGLPTVALIGGAPIVMNGGTTPVRAVSGTRKWTECSELDAQGFISVATELPQL